MNIVHSAQTPKSTH